LPPAAAPGLYLPHVANLWALFGHREWWSYLAIILPLASLDTLASLQILESVKIAGDDYPTMPSLLMNGLGTLAAAALGSPFPTTLYVGHAAHKANGARSGYSALNGLVTLVLCTTGMLPLVLRIVPLQVAGPVIVWFGLVTVGQAFAEVPKAQTVAVALGLLPMLAQWVTGIADTVARKAGSSLAEILPRMGSEFALGGLLALGQGGLLTSMLWAATLALVIERKFAQAAGWMAAASVLAAFGVIHAYSITSTGVEGRIEWGAAPEFALSYAAGTLFLLLCGWYAGRQRLG
jgi:AGZA family xanthine/uracil permease-like MFS transporter